MNAQRQWLIASERGKVIARLANSGGQPQRAITAVTRSLLLNAPYFYEGKKINPKARSLGAGVYEITMEDEN